MFGEDMINDVLKYAYNMRVEDADSVRRGRVLNYLQDTYDILWFMREWTFSFKEAPITLVAGVGTLPTDFLEIGSMGGLYDSNGVKLEEVVFPQLKSRLIKGDQESPPGEFAIFSNSSTGALEIRTLGSAETLHLHYRRISDTLVDDGITVPIMPGQYHTTVLIPGAIVSVGESLGDPRSDFQKTYEVGLRNMITVSRPRKTSIQKMPRFVSGMW